MRVYVASKFENPRAPEVAAQLEAAGHTITYKWWVVAEASSWQAWEDFKGVVTADAFVLIVEDDYRYSGALTEFGIALGRGIPIYIMGNQLDIEPVVGVQPNIFTLLSPDVAVIRRGIETLLRPATV